ncbi:19983_t:CDS:2, partial [Rhizophagus irregularis]
MWKMRSISRNLFIKVFTLIIIILCIYPLNTKAQIRKISYTEVIDYGGVPPHVWDARTYDDGTVVVRIIGNCSYEMFSLRIINTDGTIVIKDIKLEGVQQFNYCFKYKNNNDIIKYELIRKNQILVLYYNATDVDDVNTYEEYGIIIDFDGKIYDKTSFGKFKFTDQVEVELNIDREKGFIVVKYSEDEASTWQQYKVDSDGKFIALAKGVIDNNVTIDNSAIFPTNQYSELIYSSVFCGFNYVRVGQTCSLITTKSRNGNYNIKINFLSSGSIVLSSNIHYNFPVISNMTIVLRNLPFGGYLVSSSTKAQNFLYIFLFTENGTSISLQSNIVGNYLILPNNTVLFSRIGMNSNSYNSWNFDVIDVPKSVDDNGYLNANIISTYPEINSSVGLGINNISINYNHPIELSDGRLLIYQLLDDQTILLRQNISCTDDNSKCKIFNNNKNVIIQIFRFTFGISGNYFIKIENNFVKDITYKEPLLGVGAHIWKFNFINEKEYDITRSTSGLVRLTVPGTKYFQNLSISDQDQFVDQLLNDIAETVQIQLSRLSKSNVNQIDPSSNQKQLLISIFIEETKNQDEKDVNTIIRDINDAIIYKDQTLIGMGDSTTYLDSNYGFVPAPNYWQEYKFKLLGIIISVIILVVLFVLAYLREREGRNFAIFKVAIFIFDFIVDILFLVNNSKDIPRLYIPSLIFFTLPVGFNIIMAFVIISGENMRPEFFHWFTKNFRLASILFEFNSITYDIIPKLTLYTSVINLTINIVGRLYQV